MKKGFTLLEILIALALLSLGMMGIYTLIRQSLEFNSYSQEKIRLLGRGYERVILLLNDTSGLEEKVTFDNITYTFDIDKSPTMLQNIEECVLTVEDGTSSATLVYYER
ncbi:prepilin-type N-terminal cleavage/methylation domain-containing protein [Limisalsivibrio acetivorans]|uniref:prepilin-type N-terminal cleavage/methylation domain-containing protein n=1 Tax=Limisalsivibrio acetivorans TaxID=1304888 RepID=UPI0003B6B7F1|nr:prepilin-type N-terminal cleavage/methylation domain-containing protein [Limisalsivibrio acetivorans]